ncbi:hypothetical protein L3Q82_016560 [Scortum barcoo]|uniref:Uncharacterized protein n=1 Tax=Scortum barcoo TaxID=214431 RepID=A0ACB8X7T9_9TELE|nr:hypothetical protein L3Q82_016560 [Scortum barcoo]
MKSCGSQTWTPSSSPWLRLEILSIKIMNRTGDKGQALPESNMHWEQRPEQPLAKGPGPHTRGALPTEYHEGHGRMPSPDPQSTCGLVGQTPINPQTPCGGYRAGPVFHDQDENRIVPPESEGRLSAEFSSPVPWQACQPRQPHNIQRLEVLRADLIHLRRLATEELANYLSDTWVMDESTSESPASASSLEGNVGGIEEILEVFPSTVLTMSPVEVNRSPPAL